VDVADNGFQRGWLPQSGYADFTCRLCRIYLPGCAEYAWTACLSARRPRRPARRNPTPLAVAQNQTGSVVWISRTGQAGALSRLPELRALPTRHFVRPRRVDLRQLWTMFAHPKLIAPGKVSQC
jgi:hypothetical protein